jgi:hypothetical protein
MHQESLKACEFILHAELSCVREHGGYFEHFLQESENKKGY